jgi:preprotein translocase subunit YajC
MPKMSLLTDAPLYIAQAAPAPAAPSLFGSLMPIILLFAAMYFLMIAPQRKKQKAHEKMLSELKTGDEVVTNGGIFGQITNVKDDRFVIRVSDNTKIEVGKSFISTVLNKTEAVKK